MKKIIKSVTPETILSLFRRHKQSRENTKNLSMTTKQIFSDIYKHNKWGGTSGDLFSGTGSQIEQITKPYIDKIISYLCSLENIKPTIVDLGCGDFYVGRNFLNNCSNYIGVDIVPAVIDKLKLSGYEQHVKFVCLDLIEDNLPDGDICFLRQVLQHLSNKQIQTILPKLKKYQTVFITEHYPSEDINIIPNKDKICGAGIRLYENSGVYLNQAPFNVPNSALELFLEVPGHEFGSGKDKGVIRTYKLQHGSIARRATC